MDFGGHRYTLAQLSAYAKTAGQLGFAALSVNDHMVFSVPWLDGPVALATVIVLEGDGDSDGDAEAVRDGLPPGWSGWAAAAGVAVEPRASATAAAQGSRARCSTSTRTLVPSWSRHGPSLS